MRKDDYGPLDWGTCDVLLRAKGTDKMTLAGNTTLRRVEVVSDDETLNGTTAYVVRLHLTDILTFFHDGRVRIDTRGWWTVTTWDRINRYIGDRGRVWNTKGEPGYWGPYLPGHGCPDAPHDFEDGMVVDRDGFPDYFGLAAKVREVA